ncbi:haloacid dehalogenase type II [Limobrevibacterium gyesilva]|uniref:(S)-2-haloacid dehalogenase n=1 Tax=Limobrevibacterium gyesilva TaxID=2991712 RepID=A0AA41YNF4_9PROT|nr:haloacid dehalogenase type II [Limobrevibacterium gyesilva]MCW3475582.1 haloacid dehalogenase type II [Limobrevibacterium gyesilva]
MTGRLTGIRACVFDAYGTLFDFASAAARCRDTLGDKAGPLTALWRDKQLQYSWLRSLQDRYVPFDQITADALDYAMHALGIDDPALRTRLLDLYLTLSPFPEVPGVLRRLVAAGYRTAILSNGSPAMLAPLVAQPGIDGNLHAVLSVDEVRVFKTHPRVYQLAVDSLGVSAGEICFFSANAWDAWAASAFGLRVVWCNRDAHPPENLPGRPDAELRTLDQALPLLV